jgi:hypothetical protein
VVMVLDGFMLTCEKAGLLGGLLREGISGKVNWRCLT